MSDTSTQDLTQNVTATFIRGLHAVGDEKGSSPGVVSDDAKRRMVEFPIRLPLSSIPDLRPSPLKGYLDH